MQGVKRDVALYSRGFAIHKEVTTFGNARVPTTIPAEKPIKKVSARIGLPILIAIVRSLRRKAEEVKQEQ